MADSQMLWDSTLQMQANTKLLQRYSRCAVNVEGKYGDWFEVITRGKQGCVLSLFIVLMVMDWTLKRQQKS